MSVRQILENLRDGLATDQTLIDYCQANFTKNPTVFLGYNRESPPTSEQWPAVVIAMIDLIEKKGSRARHKITVGIYVGEETETPGTNCVTFDGFVKSEELREEVENAAMRLRGKLGKVEIEAATLETPLFPLFTAVTSVIVEQIISSRS